MRTIEVHNIDTTKDYRFTIEKVAVSTMNNADSIQIVANGWYAIRLLQEVLKRACNTWDNAPPEVKELHDYVVYGKLLQQYNTKVGALENQGNSLG